jgi:hypothetical protein
MTGWWVATANWLATQKLGSSLFWIAMLVIVLVAAVLVLAILRGKRVTLGGLNGFVFEATAEVNLKNKKAEK